MQPTIKSIERHINDLHKYIGQGMGNITPMEFLDKEEQNKNVRILIIVLIFIQRTFSSLLCF